MAITVEVTYDMAKALGGVRRFEVADARTVADVVRQTRERFGAEGEAFEKLTRVAAVAVNGVLSNHRKGMNTALVDGDTVTFLKAAAGG
ncbi:MAG TPA: MoaD/ThiS family protein [Candidatus Dormibacteraeota bacterium]|nr:MoaD/ThiS family protein [Candidatus Dormibacteraeota bacterium]